MNHNFKPGDLAVIVGPAESDCLWQTAELMQMVYPGVEFRLPDGDLWVLEDSGKPQWLVLVDGFYGAWEARYLMPLNGDTDQFKREMARDLKPHVLELAKRIVGAGQKA